MRHNRRAVMTEQYKLYMKKHIFNGRYFVRNLQIFMCVVVVTALVIGGFMLGNSESDKTASADISVDVKDALFGNSEEAGSVESASGSDTTEAAATTEKEMTVTEQAATEAVAAQATTEETTVQAATEETTVQATEEKEEKGKFADKCIADVEETLNIRKGPDKETEFVGSMNPGAIATVLGTEGEWTKIKSGDVEGYVLSEYVKTGESAEEMAQEYVTLRGTVLEDGVNIRSEQSTDADILVVLDKDDTITVLENTAKPQEDENAEDGTAEEETVVPAMAQTGAAQAGITESVEAAVNVQDEQPAQTEEQQEITWLPVMLEDGQTGYVSADLVDVDELYEIAVSAEELERQAAEEAARKAAEEEAARQAAAAASQSQSSGNGNSSNSSNSSSYQGATTTPVTATESGECLGTFTITAYCGCDKCCGGKKTASGTTPTEGRTIAADTSILPYGTKVVIDGIVYTVEDCGSGVNGNHIDIFFATHEKAVAYGTRTVKVYKY